MMVRPEKELEEVFGGTSKGATEKERAASSLRVYVRSQVQLAEDNDRATGHRLSAREALDLYGWDVLKRVAEEGSARLVSKIDEPAATLEARRKALNLSFDQVAKSAEVTPKTVEQAEKAGHLSSIRDLERIAQALALDEHLLGVVPGAKGDQGLGVRLREFAQLRDARRFSPTDVLALTEAAWVISRQSDLARTLGEMNLKSGFVPNEDYNYPTYERGYALAQQARKQLNIGENEPIRSLKELAEERLGIPVVQQAMAERFAGATIANGRDRGVVVNERGQNSNVWVRRMTLAHEVGHLLWDPDTRLDRLKVDQYDDISYAKSVTRDPVEVRTNAFAISFLAPPGGIKDVVSRTSDTSQAVGDAMMHFGISATAAKYHVKNVSGLDTSTLPIRDLPSPSDDWIGRENFTLDWFPQPSTPISRRGRFALLVARAHDKGLISADTAALYLKCKEQDLQVHKIIEAHK
jgi:Zn-dependent peptidase ImmA (M78 family)